jgi:pimeloyl-ACP methyl ester carboxylesterase
MKYHIFLKRILGAGLVFALLTGCRAPATLPTPTPVLPRATPPATLTSTSPSSSVTPITDVLTQTLTVGDYQYVMECRGDGSPVVLLLGGRAAAWKPIQAEINGFTRTCVFEHMGGSPNPLTAEQIANNVHTLLKDAEMTAPYVLVGFSVGGYITRLYTNLYPHEVGGITLLDSSHEDQNARFLAALPPQTENDCQELKNYRAELAGPHLLPVSPQINLDFDASAAQVRTLERNLGNLPLVVLTAGRSEWPDCFQPEVRQQLDQAWLEMQDDLASLSGNSTHPVAEESGHTFAEQPEMVIDAIQKVVRAVRTGEKVSSP